MIAGFDPDRCTDVEGLTRLVGTAGMALCSVYLLAGAVAYLAPGSVAAVSVVIAVAGLVSLGVTMSACSRFTRR
jgi:hypothetical protein